MKQVVKPAPEVVAVPLKIYVPIPDDMTQHCAIAESTDFSPLGVRHVATLRALSLKDCNINMDKIHKVQGKPVPETIK